jgi:hypothetical protein
VNLSPAVALALRSQCKLKLIRYYAPKRGGAKFAVHPIQPGAAAAYVKHLPDLLSQRSIAAHTLAELRGVQFPVPD